MTEQQLDSIINKEIEKLEKVQMIASVGMLLILRSGGVVTVTKQEYDSLMNNQFLIESNASEDGESITMSITSHNRGELN